MVTSTHQAVFDDVAAVLDADDVHALYEALLRLRKAHRANADNYIGQAADRAESAIRLLLEDAVGH